MGPRKRDWHPCASGKQWYVCNANNFEGCCSVDPCALDSCPDEKENDSSSSSKVKTSTTTTLVTSSKTSTPLTTTVEATSSTSTTTEAPTASTTQGIPSSSPTAISAAESISEDSNTQPPITSAAIGGAVGGIASGIIIAILVYLLCKRRKRARQKRRDLAGLDVSDFFKGGKGSSMTGYSSDKGVPFNADSYTYGSPEISSPPISQLDGSPVSPEFVISRITNNPISPIAELSSDSSPTRSEFATNTSQNANSGSASASQPSTTPRTPLTPTSPCPLRSKPTIVLTTASPDDVQGDKSKRAVRSNLASVACDREAGRHVMSWSQYDGNGETDEDAHAAEANEEGSKDLIPMRTKQERWCRLSAPVLNPEMPNPARTSMAGNGDHSG